MSAAEQKKVKKEELIDCILNSDEETPEIKSLTTAVESLNATLADFRQEFESRYNEQKETSLKVVNLVVQNTILRNRIHNLEDKQRENEQRSRSENIEIIGINGKDAQEDENLAIDIFSKIGVTITSDQISACHKVPTRRKDKRKPVVIKFTSRKQKTEILNAKKNLWTTINVGKEDRDCVFISEHLAPFNKFIFLKCLSVKINKNRTDSKRVFKYVWTKNGTTLLRKTDDSDVIRAECIADLHDLGIEVTEQDLYDADYCE